MMSVKCPYFMSLCDDVTKCRSDQMGCTQRTRELGSLPPGRAACETMPSEGAVGRDIVHLSDGRALDLAALTVDPIPMILTCPCCGARHIDKGEFATTKHHHTHACQACGICWRPAVVPTVGVQFLPGFKDEP